MEIDPQRTHVTIVVRAEGALARFAHDIRLEATNASGTLENEVIRARFPVDGLRVIATSRHGKDDFAPPPPTDAQEIETRIRTIAFDAGDAVDVTATRERIEVKAPRGRQTIVPKDLEVRETEGRLIVRGTCSLSLSALGTKKIAMPLGAVRLHDAVHIDFEVVLS